MKAHRAGHSINLQGANSIVNEVKETREIDKWVSYWYDVAKVKHINCTSEENTQTKDLNYGTNKANNAKAELFHSEHLNAYQKTDSPRGSEVIVYKLGTEAEKAAKRILSNLQALGFKNRGVKTNQKLHELKYTNMPAMIIESFFLDSKADVETYKKVGAKAIAKAIVEGVLNKKLTDSTPSPEAPKPSGGFKVGNYGGKVQVTASSLNVRSGRGTEHKVIGTLKSGQVVTINYILEDNKDGKGNSDLWGSFDYSRGVTGFIHLGYVKPV